MPEIARITYGQTQQSVSTDAYGMRQMQRKVFEKRDAQYLLLKAPPASGKSRAFMFIALDKMCNQGLKKTIIAVPERDIGSSFNATHLTENGFFADWEPNPDYNLCYSGSDNSTGKIRQFKDFLRSDEKILICTHATLRFAYDQLKPSDFNGVFLGIDEFHHASADSENNRLGELVKGIIDGSTAHIMAMTGSYFRGDGVAVLSPDVEQKFTSVTYSYYDQLSGYKYLHSILLSYEFYQGTYYQALGRLLDTNLKTIIHIPNVNSLESTGEKYREVDHIIDVIGSPLGEDPDTGVERVATDDGRILKVIDLVQENGRETRQAYLRKHAQEKDAVDIIIALNLAKEGFDWPACEHMLTVGYRGSLTEIVQIIGRCTRDYPGKSEARFTNLIAAPDATMKEIVTAVNDLLKAITASLLMEQVFLPKWDFKTAGPKIEILQPESDRAKKIIREDIDDLMSSILTDPEVMESIPKKDAGPLINKCLIPKIIMEKYPGLSEHDVEALRQNVVARLVIKPDQPDDDEPSDSKIPADRRLIHLANGIIVAVRDLNINLIDSVNPFGQAFEILSKEVDRPTLAAIQDAINKKKGISHTFSEEEIKIYWPQVKAFFKEKGRAPDRGSENSYEARLGEVALVLKRKWEELRNGDKAD